MNNSLSGDNCAAYCIWSLSVHNCNNSQYFIATYWANVTVCAVTGLVAWGLLIWRVRRRSNFSWNESGILEPLEGILGFLILSMISRIATSIILNIDLWPKNYIVRELLSDFQWIFGLLCVATYLVGVFRAIPRISLHQPSNCRQSSALCIPSAGTTRIVCWSFIVLHSVTVMTSSVLSGHFRMAGNHKLVRVFDMTRLFSCMVTNMCISIAFVVYGRLLVRLTKESFKLVRDRGGVSQGNWHVVSTERVDSVEDSTRPTPLRDINVFATRGTGEKSMDSHKKFKYNLWKMQIFNVCGTAVFAFFAITSAGTAIWPKTVWSTMSLSKTQAFFANVVTPAIALVIVVTILLSELASVANSPNGDQGRSRGIGNGLPRSGP